jgi:atypical dual specificity phosphatase
MIKFPKTPHLPLNAEAATDDDIVAGEEAMQLVYDASRIVVQEKLDGANLRICFDGHREPVVGNREHVLKKGYVKKATPAKLQFRPVWNWIYENKNLFSNLTFLLGGPPLETPIVFGEWMFAQHTTKYDKLPTLFFAYDIFLDDIFIDPVETVDLLKSAGFTVPPIYDLGEPEELKNMLHELSPFSSTDKREGLYFKIGDKNETTHRFKMLRPDYETVKDFTERGLIKNKLV